LTKKLADALKTSPPPTNTEVDPLVIWTANWITTWENRRAEDMLVLVNHANRFTVAVYQVKRKDLKNINEIIINAIENTLLAVNVSSELVDQYMESVGEIELTKNSDRKATSWVNRSGQESSVYVRANYNGIPEMYDDTVGVFTSNNFVNTSSKSFDQSFIPHK